MALWTQLEQLSNINHDSKSEWFIVEKNAGSYLHQLKMDGSGEKRILEKENATNVARLIISKRNAIKRRYQMATVVVRIAVVKMRRRNGIMRTRTKSRK